MINGYKVAALCVSEIQNENTQSMIDPLYQSLLEKNWRCLLFNTTTDLFRDTAFDRGEAIIFIGLYLERHARSASSTFFVVSSQTLITLS